MSFEEGEELGADIFMINTFHFYCRKEYETVARKGGLHNFLNIDTPLMTDSGGFQVFSLGAGWEQSTGKILKREEKEEEKGKKKRVKIEEDRVLFKSPFDGSKVEITPESSVKAQESLGADIIFAFDECTSPLAPYEYQEKSLKKTHRWAERSLKAHTSEKQAMMGIVQGGGFEDLRKESAETIGKLSFFGFGIGGSFGNSYGDSKENMYSLLELVVDTLPSEKPRHFLGIGEPEDIVESVKRGVDLFDCVIPTRFARHGTVLTRKGRLNIKSSRYKEDDRPLEEGCKCKTCLNYKRSYLHHLAKRKEIYAVMLLMHHNLFYIFRLMEDLREKIEREEL